MRRLIMNKSLEQQIKEVSLAQTPTFDNKAAVWNQIASQTPPKKPWWTLSISKYAAIFILGIVLTSVWYFSQQKSTKEIYFNNLYESVVQSENHYAYIMQTKYQMVVNMSADDKVFFKDLFDEIEELDKIYQQQKEELINSGFNQHVFQSMVETQKLKLDILNIILMESEKINCHENTSILI